MSFIDEWRTKLNNELLEIEKREDLTADQKVNRVRHVTCGPFRGLSPVPPDVGLGEIADNVLEHFGVQVHARSIRRALLKREKKRLRPAS